MSASLGKGSDLLTAQQALRVHPTVCPPRACQVTLFPGLQVSKWGSAGQVRLTALLPAALSRPLRDLIGIGLSADLWPRPPQPRGLTFLFGFIAKESKKCITTWLL